ncbi:MAG TPA: hypothetical protein PLN53_08865 [Terricaulis sp.]|nr:hypothetical protein [Terricaulis sp.]
MRTLVLAIAIAFGAAPAWAQEAQNGVYDGRNIAGWSYSNEMAAAGGSPTWGPSDGSASTDGMNCNVRPAPVAATRAQWQGYFDGLTAEAFAAELANEGLAVEPGNRLTQFSAKGRPALRHEMTATVQGTRFQFQTVLISGATTMLTLTCTVAEGQYEARLPLIESFMSGLQVQTAPAP